MSGVHATALLAGLHGPVAPMAVVARIVCAEDVAVGSGEERLIARAVVLWVKDQRVMIGVGAGGGAHSYPPGECEAKPPIDAAVIGARQINLVFS